MSKKQNITQILESALNEFDEENRIIDEYSDDEYESFEDKPTDEWDYYDLQDAVDEYDNYPYINAADYSDVFSFWKAVDKQFETFKENIAEYYGFSSGAEFEEFIESFDETDEYMESSEWLFSQYIGYYLNDAMAEFPEAYDNSEDRHYKCCVCDKSIEYSSKDSVMLTDEKWKEVINHYHLQKYEKDAAEKSRNVYKYYRTHGSIALQEPDDCHCFICNECIEKALGRPLVPDDLNGSVFNNEYCFEHFGFNRQPK